MRHRHPPRWLERVVAGLLPRGLAGEGALGDLAEGYVLRAGRSRGRATVWYVVQLLSILAYRVTAKPDATGSGSTVGVDLRWSFRSLKRHPGFGLGVVAVLGLGLGAVVAVYSVVDGTLRDAAEWSAPARTVAIWPENRFSFGQLELYGDEQAAYEVLGGHTEVAVSLVSPDRESRSVSGVAVTPAIFRQLADQPTLGRALADEDAEFGAEAVVVLGDALWRDSFGADPDVVGTRVEIAGTPTTIVGVQRPGADAPGGRAEMWLPLFVDPRTDDYWTDQSLSLVGLLRQGATLDDALADLNTFADRLSTLFPAFYREGWAGGRTRVARADEARRRLISTPLLLLLGGTGLLLLVTALNVGSLLLGQSMRRRKELAVRSSLGASRWRLVRQLMVEGLVLSTLALALGLVTASWLGPWIAALFVEEPIVRVSSVLSSGVLPFAATASAAAWAIITVVPVAHFLRTSGRPGIAVRGASRPRAQEALVTAQTALATLLLVSAGLLVATVAELRRIPLGFEPDGIVAVELSPPSNQVGTLEAARDLYERVRASAASVAGAERIGLTGSLPLRGGAPATLVNPESGPLSQRDAPIATLHRVDPGYFAAFGIRPTDGRLLGTEDASTRGVSAIVINETLAERLWGEAPAVGQRIAIDPHMWFDWIPVVGVVPDVRSGDLSGPPEAALYVALAESAAPGLTLVAGVDRNGMDVVGALAAAIRADVPGVPIRAVTRMEDVVRAAYEVSWVMMGLLVLLAGMATALGAVAVYAILAQHVALGRRAIGIRIALGAQPTSVVGGVIRSGLTLTGLGVALGCGAALLSNRLLESVVFEVSVLSPGSFAASALGVSLAALVAAGVPAYRAGRVPPAEIMKSE